MHSLNLLHPEWPKLHDGVLATLSAMRLKNNESNITYVKAQY